MKLIYRGIAYDYNPPQVAVKEAPMVGHYRGRELHFRNLLQIPIPQPHFHLTYRGVG
jgi:hypothetical protein